MLSKYFLCAKIWFTIAAKVELKRQNLSRWQWLLGNCSDVRSDAIHILNYLGHCVSLSSTMSYDTAIAQLVVNTSNIIPREFLANEAINLVYDNIDFGEDILLLQTHVTNGIITQKITSEN